MSGSNTLPNIDPTKPNGPIAYSLDQRNNWSATVAWLNNHDSRIGDLEVASGGQEGFLPLSGGTLTGPLILAADATQPLGAATKSYVDAFYSNSLPVTGGTMQGALDMGGHSFSNAGTLSTPTNGLLGFNGKTPIAPQTVTGSHGDGTAAARLLAALGDYGLVTDASDNSRGPANVFNFGAVGDGTTDDYPAFAAALASGAQVVYAPATANGYYLSAGITLAGRTCLIGDPASPGPGLSHGTVLFFADSTPVCVTLDGGVNVLAPGLRGIVVTRQLPITRPPAGSVGVLVQSAYNVTLADVFAWNHAIPMKVLAATVPPGVNSNSINASRIFLGAATDVFLQIQGWPEIRWENGRFGCPNDWSGATAIVRITGGVANNQYPGTGPNTLAFSNVQMNPGQPVGNFVRFDNMLGGGTTAVIYKFDNCHVENVSGAVFASNSGTSQINQIYASNVSFNCQGDMFAIDPATQLIDSFFTNCKHGGPLTVTAAATIGTFKLTSCTIVGAVHLTGAGSSTAILANNHYQSNLTLDGTWTGLMATGGDIWGNFACSASGVISIFVPPKAIMFSAIGGGVIGNARGSNAVELQLVRYAASQVASGTLSAIAGGEQNTAAGSHSVVVGGLASTADADFSWVPGGQYANSHGNVGKGCWAGGQFATGGDAQSGELIMRGHTTATNTGTIMTTDGNSESSVNTIQMQQFSAFTMRLLGVVRQGGSSNTALVAGWDLVVHAKRGAGTNTTIIGGVTSGAQLHPTWGDAALTPDVFFQILPNDNSNGLMVQAWCPGGAHGDLYWTMRVLTVEVIA